MKKRPGDMDDDERALEHLKHKQATPPAGVPINEFAPSKHDRTPVHEVIDRIERVIVLDDRDRLLIRMFWQHTANMEMRNRAHSDSQDSSALAKRIDELEDFRIELVGIDGKNGKHGTLKERVDKAEARRWWALTFIAGVLVTVIGSAIALGSWKGSIEADVETLKARTFRTRLNMPEYPAHRELP